MRRIMLSVALVFLLSTVAASAGERRPVDWPEGWLVHRSGNCVVTWRSKTCHLYAGAWRVGVVRARIVSVDGFEDLLLKVTNDTRCQMTVQFEIQQPDAFGPQQGKRTDTGIIPAGGSISFREPLYWRNGLRRVYFGIIPRGTIEYCH